MSVSLSSPLCCVDTLRGLDTPLAAAAMAALASGEAKVSAPSASTMPAEGRMWVRLKSGTGGVASPSWELVEYTAGVLLPADVVDKKTGARLCEIGIVGDDPASPVRTVRVPIDQTAAYDRSHDLNLRDVSRMSPR